MAALHSHCRITLPGTIVQPVSSPALHTYRAQVMHTSLLTFCTLFSLRHLQVVSIAASRHTLLLTRSGQVWSMGANDSSGGGGHGSRAMTASGQLGRGGGWPPGPVLGALQGHMIKAVAAGRFHSVAVTAEGAVFTWGLNDWGQLGRPAAAVQVGPSSMAAASASGLSQRESYSKDERLPHHKLLSEAAMVESGSTSSTHDAQPGSKAGSPCYSGWSCHDGSPGLITALANVAVVAARAGRYSSVLLDASGQLWVMGFDGCATAGQLPHQEEAWRPRLVQGQLQGRQVVAYDVGELLTLLVVNTVFQACRILWDFLCDAWVNQQVGLFD